MHAALFHECEPGKGEVRWSVEIPRLDSVAIGGARAMLRGTSRSIDAQELAVSRYNEDSKRARPGMGAECQRADQETIRPRSRSGRTPDRDDRQVLAALLVAYRKLDWHSGL